MASGINSITAIATSNTGKASAPVYATINVQSSPPTGDLNGSGQVEFTDVLNAYQSVLGHAQLTAAQQKNVDVAPLGTDGKPKGDGVLDIADIVLLLRHMVGLANW